MRNKNIQRISLNEIALYSPWPRRLLSIDPFELIKGKKIEGSWGGGISPDKDLLAIADKVKGTVIISGKKPHAILFELLSDKGSGT